MIPIPARDESHTEYKLASEWRQRFARELAEFYSEWIPKDAQRIKDTVKAFEDVGVDELILDSTVDGPDQVDKLAEIVL